MAPMATVARRPRHGRLTQAAQWRVLQVLLPAARLVLRLS